jgi:hypothetical protein
MVDGVVVGPEDGSVLGDDGLTVGDDDGPVEVVIMIMLPAHEPIA